MRDLLGGKGANVAEMTRVLGADRVPAGLHDHHRGVRRLHEGRPGRARRHGGPGRRRARAPAGAHGQAARRRRGPAAGLRPLRRPRVDARACSTRSSTSGSTTPPSKGSPRPPRTRASRGTPTGASCRCSATSAAASTARRSSRRSASVKADARRRGGHRPRRRRAQGARRPLQGALHGAHGRGVPAGPAGAAAARDPRRLRLLDRRPREVEYRRINRIPDEWGTAVNVQQMVFGNKGDTSGSGVAFSRDEVTGAPEPSGDFLPNAQGEDVVSGARTPRDIAEMKDWLPDAYEQLMDILRDAREALRATCRTPSSRWRTGSSTCSRRATPSGRPRPPCASRATPSRRGCSDRDQALMTVDAEMLDRAARRDLRPQGRLRGHRQGRRRRARAAPRARSSSRPRRPSTPPPRAAPSCSSARTRTPTTSPASTPPRASSRASAARPATPRSSPAAWASRASPPPPS